MAGAFWLMLAQGLFGLEIQKKPRTCGGSPSMSAAAAFLTLKSTAALETEVWSGNDWESLWSEVHAPLEKKRPVSRLRSARVAID